MPVPGLGAELKTSETAAQNLIERPLSHRDRQPEMTTHLAPEDVVESEGRTILEGIKSVTWLGDRILVLRGLASVVPSSTGCTNFEKTDFMRPIRLSGSSEDITWETWSADMTRIDMVMKSCDTRARRQLASVYAPTRTVAIILDFSPGHLLRLSSYLRWIGCSEGTSKCISSVKAGSGFKSWRDPQFDLSWRLESLANRQRLEVIR